MNKHNKKLNQQIPPSQFQITATGTHFSGPLPPPEILAKYNDAVPNGAERIVAMAEKQMQHRHDLEKAVIEANCKTQKRGPIFGFIVSMTAIIGGIYLILQGKNTEGLAAIITALTALAVVFIVGRKQQQKDLENKQKALGMVRS